MQMNSRCLGVVSVPAGVNPREEGFVKHKRNFQPLSFLKRSNIGAKTLELL